MMIALIILGVLLMVGGIATALSDYFENKKVKLLVGILSPIIGFGLSLLGYSELNFEKPIVMVPDSEGKMYVVPNCTPEQFEAKVREFASLMADSLVRDRTSELRASLNKCLHDYALQAKTPFELGVLAFLAEKYDSAEIYLSQSLSDSTLLERQRADANVILKAVLPPLPLLDNRRINPPLPNLSK